MASKIKFVKELPPELETHMGAGGATWRKVLKKRPGEWALVYTGPSSSSTAIQYGQAKKFAGQYEIERRGLEVYARYIGESVK